MKIDNPIVSGSLIVSGSTIITGDISSLGTMSINDGGNSVYVGENAGRIDDLSDNRNVGVGYQALYYNTTGYNNIAQGYRALFSNTFGYRNTANGYESLRSNTLGYNNNAYGFQSAYSNISGVNNVANGAYALYSNISGNCNTVSGVQALYSNTTGYENVAFGSNAGRYYGSGADALTTANNSIFIGVNTRASSNSNTNEIVIGSDTIGNGSNSVTLGNTSISKTILKGNVGIGTTIPSEKLHIVGNSLFTGDLTVTGKVTAQEFHTEFVSASIIYQSGSTQFGNSIDDTHNFIGTVSASNFAGDGSQLTSVLSMHQENFTLGSSTNSVTVTSGSLPSSNDKILIYYNGQFLNKTYISSKTTNTINLTFSASLGDQIDVVWYNFN